MNRLQRRVWEKDPRMHIVYAPGYEAWGRGERVMRRTPSRPIQSKSTFSMYIEVAEMKRLQFDVVVNDGHVKPQVALAVKSRLPMGGYMIVFDTARPDKKHYNIISKFYRLVKE